MPAIIQSDCTLEIVPKELTDVYETQADLDRLQQLLDDSYAAAGAHLTSIHTGRARLSARQVADELTGMQIFVVATVARDGRPFTGPVDTFLYRGVVCFGTSPEALRVRHLTRSPAVSATHVRGEALVVSVHGRARLLNLDGDDASFRDVLVSHYGAGFEDWGGDSPYYAIEPDRMFAADMRVHTAPS